MTTVEALEILLKEAYSGNWKSFMELNEIIEKSELKLLEDELLKTLRSKAEAKDVTSILSLCFLEIIATEQGKILDANSLIKQLTEIAKSQEKTSSANANYLLGKWYRKNYDLQECGLIRMEFDPSTSLFEKVEELLQGKNGLILFNNTFYYADINTKKATPISWYYSSRMGYNTINFPNSFAIIKEIELKLPEKVTGRTDSKTATKFYDTAISKGHSIAGFDRTRIYDLEHDVEKRRGRKDFVFLPYVKAGEGGWADGYYHAGLYVQQYIDQSDGTATLLSDMKHPQEYFRLAAQQGHKKARLLLTFTQSDKQGYQKEFNLWLDRLNAIAEKLKDRAENDPEYVDVSKAALQLHGSLTTESNEFFGKKNPNAQDFEKFTKNCKKSIQTAMEEFVNPRGLWKNVPAILKAILGVLAIMSVIPVLVITIKKRSAYEAMNLFFQSKRPTKSERLLKEVEENIDKGNTEMNKKLMK